MNHQFLNDVRPKKYLCLGLPDRLKPFFTKKPAQIFFLFSAGIMILHLNYQFFYSLEIFDKLKKNVKILTEKEKEFFS